MEAINYVHEQLGTNKDHPTFRPGDNIVVTYKRGDEVQKTNATLSDSKSAPMKEKMIWKTKDGETIEIHEDHDIHFEEKIEEGKDGEKKIIKKKIIKKKKDN